MYLCGVRSFDLRPIWEEATFQSALPYLYRLSINNECYRLWYYLLLAKFAACSIIYGAFLNVLLCTVLCCVCVFSTQIHMHSLDTFRSACDFPVGQSTSVGCCLHHLFNNVESKSRCLLYVGDWGQSRSNVLSCFDAFDFRFRSRAFIMNAWHVNGATTTKNRIRRQKTRLLLASIHFFLLFFSSAVAACCSCCYHSLFNRWRKVIRLWPYFNFSSACIFFFDCLNSILRLPLTVCESKKVVTNQLWNETRNSTDVWCKQEMPNEKINKSQAFR